MVHHYTYSSRLGELQKMYSLSFPESIFPINIFHLFGRGRPFLPLDCDDKVLIKRLTSCIWERLNSQASSYSGVKVRSKCPPSPWLHLHPHFFPPAFLQLLSAKVRHSSKPMLHEGDGTAYHVLSPINGSQETLITRRCCNP